METVEEVKVHKNKETQRFHCQVLHREKSYIILQYKSATEGKIDDIIIDKGSSTIAHYWKERGFVLWRIFDAKEMLIGTLFHICSNMDISNNRVTYFDLIVDVWIAADGTIRVLDEDELEECKRARLLTRDEVDWIDKQKRIILKNYKQIISEVMKIETDYWQIQN
jgi:predicted RNA-binding protein associated with RNAse of E/G family